MFIIVYNNVNKTFVALKSSRTRAQRCNKPESLSIIMNRDADIRVRDCRVFNVKMQFFTFLWKVAIVLDDFKMVGILFHIVAAITLPR